MEELNTRVSAGLHLLLGKEKSRDWDAQLTKLVQ